MPDLSSTTWLPWGATPDEALEEWASVLVGQIQIDRNGNRDPLKWIPGAPGYAWERHDLLDYYNYIKNGLTRVDFFKPSGKWKYTGYIDMRPYYHTNIIHDAVTMALDDGIEGITDSFEWRTYISVCITPNHEHSHPVTIMPTKT